MKLLPKSEVEKAKAADKKREIDEGMKLAQRVDNLRETAAFEATELDQWRKQTVKAIHDEISTVQTQLDLLKTEVRDLEHRKKAALEPLDEQWGELKEAQRRFDEVKAQHVAWANRVGEQERDLITARNQHGRAESGLVRRVAECDARFQRATEAEERAKQNLTDAAKIKEDALAVRQSVDEELSSRELAVSLREASAKMKESLGEKSRKRIAAGWRLLNDRKTAFYRDVKRSSK